MFRKVWQIFTIQPETPASFAVSKTPEFWFEKGFSLQAKLPSQGGELDSSSEETSASEMVLSKDKSVT